MEIRVHSYEKQHLRELRKYLGECTVLLKSNGDFPLENEGKIALFGNGARHTIKGGTGSGEVNSRFQINVEQGLEKAGFEITTKDWLDSYDNVYKEAKERFIRDLRKKVGRNPMAGIMEVMGAIMPEPEHHLPLEGEGDVAVYVLSRISGEGTDRKAVAGDILLTKTEIRDINRLQKSYPKFMLILNVGGPVDLSPVDAVENILVLSQLGVETGTAVADLLLGKTYPSGKLATTWTAWEDYPQMGNFGDRDDTRYEEGVYVGYRYFDSVGKKAMYPFGHGLGYTTFEMNCEQIHLEKEVVCLSVKVTNKGSFAGKEVVQLYVSVPQGKLDQPYQTLAAWKKTSELKPGDSEIVELRFAMSDLASYDMEAAAYILEEGFYVLRLGSSSTATEVCGVISLEEGVVVRQTRNCLGDPGFTDWKPEPVAEEETEDETEEDSDEESEEWEVPVLVVEADAIATEMVVHDVPEDMDWEVAALSDEELIQMNIGHFETKPGPGSVIGMASTRVAGAAGEPSHVLEKLDVDVPVMADGPAGLRLNPKYFVDKEGQVHGMGSAIPESMADLLPGAASWLMNAFAKKPRRGQMLHEQYCTAIPIGTALAQSWNLELAQLCGDIVGDEMERFHVQLWLAPALNIHRDIRCGRNFEYYSEDPFVTGGANFALGTSGGPLISGLMAAAITLGVQKHPGCGVTIKHYAANNQETNRYNSNSLVSERAMREIYLRGFGICVREAQPLTVMTSYNLLNGTHTSEHPGLLREILRDEYGFKGLVMTDWVVAGGIFDKESVHPAPRPTLVAKAGNDLFMPGSKSDAAELKKGLKDKEVSSEQLAINASRLFRLAKKLQVRDAAKSAGE